MRQMLLSAGVAGRFLQVVPITVLVGLVYAVLRVRSLRRSRRPVFWGRELLNLLFVCYLTGLANLVLVPEHLWSDFWYWLMTGYGAESTWTAPFAGGVNWSFTLWEWVAGRRTMGSWVLTMLVGNLLMFVPLGFFLALLAQRVTPLRVCLWTAGIPAVVEAIQWVIGRSVDADDLLLNAAGILLGTAVGGLIRRMAGKGNGERPGS